MTSVSIFINLIRRFLIWKEISISVRLGSAFCISQMHVLVAFFFFFNFLSQNVWLFPAWYALFTDPQILLFSHFFIKNGSHSTIHIFENYFVTEFSVFSFQFWSIFKRILNVTQRLKVAQSNTISRLDSAHQSIINYRI